MPILHDNLAGHTLSFPQLSREYSKLTVLTVSSKYLLYLRGAPISLCLNCYDINILGAQPRYYS